MMKLTKFDWASILIIIILFVISAYVYPTLSDQIPTHWNAAGEVDDWSAPEAIFLMPAIMFLVFGLFLIIPSIAVFQDNIPQFKQFPSLKLVIILFFTFIYAATLTATLGYDLNMSTMILPAVGLLLLYFGYILPHSKRNFFIGIRTPWTLANDHVWKKTHQIAGKLFMFFGLLMFIAAFITFIMIFAIVLIILAILGLVVYSYFIWKMDGKKKTL